MGRGGIEGLGNRRAWPSSAPMTDRTLHPHLQPQLLITQVTALPQAVATPAWACSVGATT